MANLTKFFPKLMRRCQLSMGHPDQGDRGFRYKMQRLTNIMSLVGGSVKMIDDDEEVKRWLRPIDLFCHAPEYWAEKESE